MNTNLNLCFASSITPLPVFWSLDFSSKLQSKCQLFASDALDHFWLKLVKGPVSIWWPLGLESALFATRNA